MKEPAVGPDTRANASLGSSGGRAPARGFTMVEVLVVVAILAILAALSARIGLTWSNNAKLTQSTALLQQAFWVAKSTALQNNVGQTNNAPSAVLCFIGQQMAVYSGSDCSGASPIIWTRPISPGVALTFGTPGTAASCIALSNSGLPVGAAGAVACTTDLNFSVKVGTLYGPQQVLR